MGQKVCSIIQAVALLGCLTVTMHTEGEHMNGMRRAVETADKTRKPTINPALAEALNA